MKVDISSTVVEKSIDAAKVFLSKLLGSAVEESGLLISDQVTMWRFRNQVRMLNRALETCSKHNISPKNISLKLLCPLLDYAGLEDDEELQDKWANLLANMVDTEQNIDNHVFPYLLSQISTTEFKLLDNIVKQKIEKAKKLGQELDEFKSEYPELRKSLQGEMQGLRNEIELRKSHNINGRGAYIPIQNLEASLRQTRFKLELLDKQEANILSQIARPEALNEKEFKEHELGNLIRLGIFKSVSRPYIKTERLEIPNEPESEYLSVDLDIEIHADYDDHILTKLGELFVMACSEKKSAQENLN